mmetsp:Transcript_54675/g.138043  ORF Transcript_54675/g.138043 Transcript_54675/m.138043 type:complete len:191 (-) Transcript_54675:146-718(-)
MLAARAAATAAARALRPGRLVGPMLQPSAPMGFGGGDGCGNAAVGLLVGATRCSGSSTASGSGARRAAQSRAARSRMKVRRRSTLLELLSLLREADLELHEGVGPDLSPWSGVNTRWHMADEHEELGPVSLLSTSVDESRAIVDPDLYEIEVATDRFGRQIIKVVQMEGHEENEEESPLDEPFLPFGVHQ